MSDPSSIVRFYLKNNIPFLAGKSKKKEEFYLIVHNVSPDYLPQVKVYLTGPPQVKIWTKSENYGGISRGKQKSRLFQVYPKQDGIYTLNAQLIYKRGELMNLPIELRVGSVESFVKTPQPVSVPPTQPIEAPQPVVSKAPVVEKKITKCSYCNSPLEPDSKFCSVCGAEIEEQKAQEKVETYKFCSNCGAKQPATALFCGECGTTL